MRYEPEIVPSDLKDLERFLSDQLRNISDIQIGVTYIDMLSLKIMNSAPHDVFPGLIAYADGVSWNPGSGEGVYRHNIAGAWVFVG